MSKERATIGTDGLALPILPPERDARVWARLVRVMFYLPGFMALLLIKAGEPASFGITVELLMLSSAAAIVGGLYIGAESSGAGGDSSSSRASPASSVSSLRNEVTRGSLAARSSCGAPSTGPCGNRRSTRSAMRIVEGM